MKFRKNFLCEFVLLLSFAILFLSFSIEKRVVKETSNARHIINELLKSIDNVKTLKYNLKLSERINGKMVNTKSEVKLQTSPRKLYLYLKGPELLWIQGKNDGDALVNPGAFPYFNLNLDPLGSLMRKDQHHTIHEMGYEYFASILRSTINKIGDKFDKYIVYTGDEKWENRDCYKIVISYPDFGFENYTVQKGENLLTIARKLNVAEYMILENNQFVKDYYNVKEGTQLRIPNAYAKLTVLMIDKEHMLPINNKVFDDKGLFEYYEYHNLQYNPVIAAEEFTRNYKGYNF